MGKNKLDAIREVAQESANKLTGPLGFGFFDLQTGESCYINGDKLFPTASVFKIFVLAELFRKLSAGEIQLEDRYPLTEEMKAPGSGVLADMSAGTNYSLYDYAYLMNTLSDNTSADFLWKFVGRENIYKNVLNPLGLNKTKVDLTCADLFKFYCNIDPSLSPQEQFHEYYTGDFLNNEYYHCTQEFNDVTTAEELSKFYSTIYDGDWCSREISNQMLNLMKKCQTNSRIPKKLPSGTAVAHKTGTFDRLVNDSGIVYTDKGSYIISMMYNGNLADADEYYNINKGGAFGDEMLANLSKEVYDIFTEKES